jgi:hypothetical protein
MGWFLFFLVVVPFGLMNITAYRKERRQSDEELRALLEENNDLLKKVLASTNTR